MQQVVACELQKNTGGVSETDCGRSFLRPGIRPRNIPVRPASENAQRKEAQTSSCLDEHEIAQSVHRNAACNGNRGSY